MRHNRLRARDRTRAADLHRLIRHVVHGDGGQSGAVAGALLGLEDKGAAAAARRGGEAIGRRDG